MSTTTANLGLVKPEYSDTADIQKINQNMDKLDGTAGGTMNAIAIVANGNTHMAVLSGQCVYVRGHASLAEGLYVATAAIPANGTLSTSNLTAVSGGGLNMLLPPNQYPTKPEMHSISDLPSSYSTGWSFQNNGEETDFPMSFSLLLTFRHGGRICQFIIRYTGEMQVRSADNDVWNSWRVIC